MLFRSGIDKTWHHCETGRIDDFRVGSTRLGVGTDGDDIVAIGENRGVSLRRRARSVDDVSVAQEDGCHDGSLESEVNQTAGVGECFGVTDRAPVHHVGNRQLAQLARTSSGQFGNRNHERGNVSRGQSGPYEAAQT